MMKTVVMDEPSFGTPWLEHIPFNGSSPERTPLLAFPFTIGRSETAGLSVTSSRVSCEHVIIQRDGPNFHVKDNGSTNGTFVNGQQI